MWPQLTQSKVKQAWMFEKEKQTYPKRLETSQNDPKRNKFFVFSIFILHFEFFAFFEINFRG